MTEDELCIMFYNGIYFQKTGKLLDEYNMFEYLYIDDLLNQEHKKYYKTKLKTRTEGLS